MSSYLRSTHLIDNCTPSISYDRQVQAASEAFDHQMFEIIDDTGQIIMIPNIMNLTDSKLVDILAWQFSVDFYDATKDLEFRKRLVQQSIAWHKTKGTMALVQEVLNTYWPAKAWIEEWYEYMSPLPPNYPATDWHRRYLFRIVVNQEVIDPVDETMVLKLIERYKPVSRWPDYVLRPESSGTVIYAMAVAQMWITCRSEAAPIRNPNPPSPTP
jgi:phage tail P2-like protein